MATRGCGDRVAGGVYLVCSLSENGRPLSDFLCCPVRRIPDGIAMSAQGQVVIDTDTEQMVFDHIGSGFYPNPTDWIEEVRHLGMSAHASMRTALAIKANAWLYATHSRAIILNWMEYPARYMGECAKRRVGHEIDIALTDRDMPWFAEMYPDPLNDYRYAGCSGYMWEDIVGGVPVNDPEEHERLVVRRMPSFSYRGFASPGIGQFEEGIICRLPINEIHVIRGGSDNLGERRHERLSGKLDLPVYLEAE